MRILLVLLLALTCCVQADSPLTSTDFHTAYGDIKLVAAAAKSHKLNKEMAAFLSSPKTPIDQKAALCNALGWNIDGQTNASAFQASLGTRAPTPDEQFCLGYLTALDHYKDVSKAVPMLQKARKALPKSYTVALIAALVEAQYIGTAPDQREWAKIWPSIKAVLDNKSLKFDMRPAARDIILEYMEYYKDYK